ncbi:MAG: hypothetical protein JF607_23865 [Burkholderiales bacterium]|jgi:tRNA 2-selenouridine synthase|nr:hypothetical protein [Burkholderiales bacterium]
MATPLASLDALVHPHQIEVQEFGSYALVIDARSAEAYQDDHIPGAVNVPVGPRDRPVREPVTDFTGVRDSEPGVPYVLAAHVRRLEAGGAVLVYCDRGGLDSQVWSEPLKAAGYYVDVLAGGWINYRRWVEAGLDVLPRALSFRVLVAPPVSGLSRIVARLTKRGEQVLDLTALAGQRLVPGLTLSVDTPPSQNAFETQLLQSLRRFDARRPVWIRISLCGFGDLVLPPSLRDVVARSVSVRLEVPLGARARAWNECLTSKGADADRLLEALSESSRPPRAETLDRWRSLYRSGQVVEALAEVITAYVEPCRVAEHWQRPPQVVTLPSLAPKALASVVDAWCGAAASSGADWTP